MNDRDEELLRQGLLTPPPDFLRRTMLRIESVPPPLPQPHRWAAMRELAQWIALAGTAVVGAMQLLSYMFGIWIIGTAG